jgi:hypothetical protein
MRILPPKCPRGGRCKIRKRAVFVTSFPVAHQVGLRRICVKCGKFRK